MPANPLLDGLRIEPTPGPTTLVIFGASGDLTRRKLLPALYSSVARAAPAGPLHGHRRRARAIAATTGSASSSTTACGVRRRRRSPTRSRGRWPSGSTTSSGELRRSARSISSSPAQLTRDRRRRRRAVLPGDPAGGLRDRHRAARRRRALTRRRRRDGWRRVIVEKPFGTDLDSARELNRLVHRALRRVAGLPHRSLSREGNRPEPDGVPLRERHVRADLEPPLHRSRADHRRRDRRRRAARELLRGGRRAARHGPESPDAAARARRDGAADRVHRRERARSEDGRAARRSQPLARRRRDRTAVVPRAVRRGMGRAAPRCPAIARSPA